MSAGGRPEVCVGAIAVHDGAILLVERGRDPARGRWSVPGGRVEHGETLAQAVERELAEETGLAGHCGDFVGWTEGIIDGYHFVILDFRVAVEHPERAVAGDDAAQVAWVPLRDVAGHPALADGVHEFLERHGLLAPGP